MDSSAATFVQQHPLRKNAVQRQRQVKTVRRQSINRGPKLFPDLLRFLSDSLWF